LREIATDDAVIDLAKRTKDWPLLERAVEKKLDDQQDFVNWWRGNVSKNHGGDRSKNADRRSWDIESAATHTGITQQQVSKWAKRLAKRDEYRSALFSVAYKKAMGELATASELVLQSLSNEHYTPARYIEAARATMEAIDLDPASCDEAQKIVKAAEYFTLQRSGLDAPWRGRVWLNPPYGGLAEKFISKLMAEIESGAVLQAVILVNAHCTDTGWFQPLFHGLVCFTNHRINFCGDDTRSGSTHGSMFAYFGDRGAQFYRLFSQFGTVLRRV
jgi:DNA N-6-adenine-methyltransferase (Dam)